MFEIVILYILNKYDATIYRICKIIDEFFFAYLKSSAGTVNPALKRLEKLGCVEYEQKTTEGGMLSKTYSITQTGKKHLSDLILNYKEKNPYHILNTAKILLYCCNVLTKEELAEFKLNLSYNLELYKIKLEKGLKNEYINLNEVQKQTVETTLKEVQELLKLL